MIGSLAGPGRGAVLVDCALWDGHTASAVQDQALRIAPDGTIRAVGGAEEVLAQARDDGDAVVELGGATVTPGLVNMHVHLGLALPGPLAEASRAATDAEQVLLMAGNARDVLRAGVTTVRLVGESRFADMALRGAIRRGQVDGPTIYTAGHALCCTGGHGHGADAVEADGADGFRRATREQIRAGADLIKVCISGGIAGEYEQINTPQLTDDEMSAVISTAHDWGRKVTAHAGPSEVIARAVELGLDCVEHGYELEAGLCATMAERGVAYCPTITVSRCEQFFLDSGVPRWMIDRALSAGPRHWQSLQHAIAAGVPIIMGTDMPPQVPYDETTATVREMEFMAKAGMSAHAVMVSATSAAAAWLGAAGSLGSLAPGAQADLLVLDGDPTLDVSALRALHGVVRAGQVARDDRGLLRVGGAA
ncbi:amidohydrolase family protein [Phytoactinopolyspora alkaliphila]|uniref:Amidohydrolase family protein n=1 Tax=Phytoactinopolyspora alkaliphila TaxID=1783498 RepID=A0A6N9YQB0_9ACTN|nr:amidohydrolase family protein [Phytoactinopolyspora alkaliphila]NED97028.1 amidohydrolase family protein [Phytoactinopolyspora alkaliphila]